MAIDGVAPRAKMNQQRSRRFRAAKEVIEKELEIKAIRDKLESEGIPLPPAKKPEEKFDSNCITPGTPFMDRLAVALRYYVHNRVTLDPAWANIQVILSDANVPGEGEHKIMDFIRRQRASPSHDPNTVHCLCGADADLIMLGLATHEANFNILREEFVPNQPRACELCQQYGHELKDCRGLAADQKPDHQSNPVDRDTAFIFLRLPVLREYLARDLEMPNLPFPYDLERAIDDWVFMCFFVGNDFLPHLPSLEIRENAIDRLIRLYKDMVYKAKGWLTDSGEVYMDRVQIMMVGLGHMEDQIFRNRQQREESFKRRNKQQRRQQRREQQMPSAGSIVAPLTRTPGYMGADEFKSRRRDERMNVQGTPETLEAEARLKAMLQISAKNPDSETAMTNNWQLARGKRPSHDDYNAPAAKYFKEEESEEEVDNDNIRLHEPGWKERYYINKFGEGSESREFRHEVARDYVEGLCWVLKYYYQGCASWDWYYPHHYAPFSSDFDDIKDFVPDFTRPTKPFNPLEQLMAVFPAASRAHIPEAWHHLMLNDQSPLIDFYPPDFEIDLNGKRFAWQGVALLPFVDQQLLLSELAKVYHQLTDEEKRRNVRGTDRIFVGKDHPLAQALIDVFASGKEVNFEVKRNADGAIENDWVHYDPSLTNGMAGEIAWDKDAVDIGGRYPSIFRNQIDYPDVNPNMCVMTAYRDPVFPRGFKYSAERLPGAAVPEPVLKPKSYDERSNGRYQPNVGFTRDRPHANLSDAGHRMVNNSVRGQRGNGNRGGQNYNNNRQQQNSYQQISYNESTPYVGYFDDSNSRDYNRQTQISHQPRGRGGGPGYYNYPQPPAPPSFSDMAYGNVAPAPYGAPPGGNGGGYNNYNGPPRRGQHNQESRHRPYDNRRGSHPHHSGNSRGGRGGGGGGGYRN
uniref:5'-3' exoribonuclease n=1 Tax=Panagrellus redivivus TaxID=6233 RepID=A0A7E4V7F8_PANRE